MQLIPCKILILSFIYVTVWIVGGKLTNLNLTDIEQENICSLINIVAFMPEFIFAEINLANSELVGSFSLIWYILFSLFSMCAIITLNVFLVNIPLFLLINKRVHVINNISCIAGGRLFYSVTLLACFYQMVSHGICIPFCFF